MSSQLNLSGAQLLDILNLSKNATAIYTGNDLVIQYANDAMLAFWNKDRSVIGKPLEETVPELKGQPLKKILQDVLLTGITYSGVATPAELLIGGKLQTFCYDFEYRAITSEAGGTCCILHTASDVTERELNRVALQNAKEQEEAQTKALIESESNLRLVIMQAPVAIAIFRGAEYLVETVNDRALELWGRNKGQVMGKPILEAMPELKSQGIKELLDNVYHKGESFAATELPVELIRHGQKGTAFIDFVYEPLYDSGGTINGVITIGTEVTSQVMVRKKLEDNAKELQSINEELGVWNEESVASNEELRTTNEELQETQFKLENLLGELVASEEKLKIAIDTAKLGTWSVDLKTDKLTVSDRSREIHGLTPDHQLTLSESLNMVLPEDRAILEKVMTQSLDQKSSFELEYQIQPLDGSSIKWLRSTGKIYCDENDEPITLTGTIMDITERKLDELRKNDFIGMVSHELKTPLTSLTAIVQLAGAKLKNNDDAFLNTAMDRANTQVKKMVVMINGFLNISRLESGKIHLNMQQFDLQKLLVETIDELKLTVSGYTFPHLANESVVLWADRDKIGSVVTNLLSNAVKYSPRETTITVKYSISDGMAKVSVRDEGVGISKNDIDNLFDRYYRVESVQARHISGFGIGLYLSAEIIKRHNGKIWVESELDKGSTFYFTLPLLQ